MNYDDMTPDQKIVALGADDTCYCDHKRKEHHFKRDGWETPCKFEGCLCKSFNLKHEPLIEYVKHALWLVGFIGGLGLLFIFVINPISTPYLNQWQQDYEERLNWKFQTWATVDVSKDCSELQNALLELSAKGANADSWFPDSYDKMMKTGKERYEILKC